MELFQKDRYIFSTRRNKKEVLNDDKLFKQIKLFKKAIEYYCIKLKYLYNDVPSIEKKNLILNISKYICGRKLIMDKIKKRKKIPIQDIAFETKIKVEFIEKYKEYILVYIILFSDERFNEIVKYLKIEFRELDELSLVPVVDNTEKSLKRGLAIHEFGGKVTVLTNQGEFLRIVDNDEWQLANEAVGKECLGLKKHYKKLMIIVPIIVVAMCIMSYIYNSVTTTILIRGTSEIKVDVNKFNKVVSVYSPTEKGKELMKNLKLNHKNVDKSISQILIYLEKNAMVSKSNSIKLAITGTALDFDKLKETNELVKSKELNKNRYNLVINNSGSQVIIKP